MYLGFRCCLRLPPSSSPFPFTSWHQGPSSGSAAPGWDALFSGRGQDTAEPHSLPRRAAVGSPAAPSPAFPVSPAPWTWESTALQAERWFMGRSCVGFPMGIQGALCPAKIPVPAASALLHCAGEALLPISRGRRCSSYESVNGPVLQIFFSPIFYFFSLFFCLFPSG